MLSSALSPAKSEADFVALRTSRKADLLAVLLMLAAVLAVYCPTAFQSGKIGLIGTDHLQLHMRRMAFAREALLGENHTLPGWYPRELLGTPFWSNVQNFPFLPTRLLVLLLAAPFDAFTFGTLLAAMLAAAFTFGFCRSAGLSRLAAATSGWTFASAGFFAARVLAGHLPLLEAYPALPLLLWLAQRALAVRDEPRRFGRRVFGLGLAAGAISLAGHPQLPIYALATTALYLLFQDRGRTGLIALTALIVGPALAAFSLWPMFLLTGRSTRLLALDAANNDIALPYGRLRAFFLPWADGWPNLVARGHGEPFHGYPGAAYFWDTVSYVGWTPWLALLVLAGLAWGRRERWFRPWIFFARVGGAALLCALPFWQQLLQHLPGTFLRSPARQLYLTTFALALGLGVAIDTLLRRVPPAWRTRTLAAIAVVLAAHGIDLWKHDRAFVVTAEFPEQFQPEVKPFLDQQIADGRIGMDWTLTSRLNREFDDVGFFDSIMLARAYRGISDLSALPPGRNVQHLDGSELTTHAVAACGARLLVTRQLRLDLTDLATGSRTHFYQIPRPADRVAFFPETSIEFLPVRTIHKELRDPGFDLTSTLLLRHNRLETEEFSVHPIAPPMAYRRPSPDVFEVKIQAPAEGYLRILEAWDRGWSAEVDGQPATVVAGDDLFLAVHLTPGLHAVRLTFATPGVRTGLAISFGALLALGGLARWASGTKLPARL